MMNSGGPRGDMGETYGFESGTGPLVADPGSVLDIAAAIAGGRVSVRDVLETSLNRIEAVERLVQGWCVMDRDDARVWGVCIAESVGGADQGLSDFGIRIHPPGTRGDEPQQIDVQVVVARGAGLRCCLDEGLVPGGIERASEGRLLDPRHSRAVELAEIAETDLSE